MRGERYIYVPCLYFLTSSSSSSTCFLQQDGRVSNCSPYHVITQPPSLISMDDLQFDQHALSLYRFYRERGCLVTFQLWTTEDGGEHFKISRPPPTLPFRRHTLPFRPATKVFPNIVPLSSKTRKSPGRQRRDQRRLEQHRAAKQTGPHAPRAETSAPVTGTVVSGAGTTTPAAGTPTPKVGILAPGAGTHTPVHPDSAVAKPSKCSPHYHQRNFVMGDTVVWKFTGTRKGTSVMFKLFLENLFHIICKNLFFCISRRLLS